MSEALARELGRLNANMEHMKETQDKMLATVDGMDARLRKVETRSAINGAVTGGVMAVAVSFAKEALKGA